MEQAPAGDLVESFAHRLCIYSDENELLGSWEQFVPPNHFQMFAKITQWQFLRNWIGKEYVGMRSLG